VAADAAEIGGNVEGATLLYDAKCELCRGLALKVRHHAKRPLAIVALTDPEAGKILRNFYAGGWTHDFYLIDSGTCRKGVAALPKLLGLLGPRQFGLLIGEYAAFRVARTTCDHKHEKTAKPHAVPAAANGTSRRHVIAMAAAAPLLAPLSRLPKLSGPFEPRQRDLPGISVNVALVWSEGPGVSRTEVKAVPDAVRATGSFENANVESKVHHREDVVVAQSRDGQDGAPAAHDASDGPRFMLRRTTLRGERIRDGVAEARFMDFYGLGADYGRYNVSLSVGRGHGGVSLAGIVRHDLAVPVLDYVMFVGDEELDATGHLTAYREGVRELRRFHAEAGRERLASLYGEIEAGFANAVGIYRDNASERLVPFRNELVITSAPELMKFVDLRAELARFANRPGGPAHLRPAALNDTAKEGGCNCSCSCACCCAIGCGIGASTCPGICGLCCGCGCGCGCGCCL
jgi:hypothetical protein